MASHTAAQHRLRDESVSRGRICPISSHNYTTVHASKHGSRNPFIYLKWSSSEIMTASCHRVGWLCTVICSTCYITGSHQRACCALLPTPPTLISHFSRLLEPCIVTGTPCCAFQRGTESYLEPKTAVNRTQVNQCSSNCSDCPTWDVPFVRSSCFAPVPVLTDQ